MILGWLAFGPILLVGAVGYRISAFLFPIKGPFFWEEGYHEEELTSEDEEGNIYRER